MRPYGTTGRPGTGSSTPTATSTRSPWKPRINYASDLAACGDLAAAIRVGQETLARCRGSLGEDHPVTLMAAANLALDEAASGNQAAADELLADVLHRYAEHADHGTSRGARRSGQEPA